MRYADAWFVRVNLLLLLVVSFLPFPTKLVAEAIVSRSAERVAVLFYGMTLLVISTIISAMGRYVARRDDLRAEAVVLQPDVADRGDEDLLLPRLDRHAGSTSPAKNNR